MVEANTKSLLHFNGADGATSTTDEAGKSWTFNGNAQLDTAQKKFGTASLVCDGAGDHIDTLDDVDWDVGSEEFTIELFMRPAGSGTRNISGQINSGGSVSNISHSTYIDSSHFFNGRVVEGTTIHLVTGTTPLNDSAFHHVAYVRDNSANLFRLFVDGTQEDSLDSTGITVNNSAFKMAIGRLGELDFSYYNGHIDEFRFTRGEARYTSNFTPPSGELESGIIPTLDTWNFKEPDFLFEKTEVVAY